MDEKSTWSPTWWTMDKVSWSHGIYARPTSKRRVWCKFWETMTFVIFFQHDIFLDWQTPQSSSLKLVEFETYYINQILPAFSANKICNGLQHDPFSLHTMLEGPWIPKTAFPTTHGTAFGWESRVLTITRSRLLAYAWNGPNSKSLANSLDLLFNGSQ